MMNLKEPAPVLFCDVAVGDLVRFDFMPDEMACNIVVKKRPGT